MLFFKISCGYHLRFHKPWLLGENEQLLSRFQLISRVCTQKGIKHHTGLFTTPSALVTRFARIWLSCRNWTGCNRRRREVSSISRSVGGARKSEPWAPTWPIIPTLNISTSTTLLRIAIDTIHWIPLIVHWFILPGRLHNENHHKIVNFSSQFRRTFKVGLSPFGIQPSFKVQ
jgi:hypothetical protein